MIVDDPFDFILEELLLLLMQVDQLVQILTCRFLCLVGKAHLDLSLLFLQRESVDRFCLNFSLHWLDLGFFDLGLLDDLNLLLFFLVGHHLQRFFLLSHGWLAKRLHNRILGHERGDLILEVGLSDIHNGVHLFHAFLNSHKSYHIKLQQFCNGLPTQRIIHLDRYLPFQ